MMRSENTQVFIAENVQTLKGNLHTHTTRSDGYYDLEDVVGIYKKENYDFLAVSDHDLYYTGDIDEKVGKNLVLLHGIEATCTYRGNDPAMGDYAHFTCMERKLKNDAEYKEGFYEDGQGVQNYIDALNKKYRLIQFNHPLFSKLLDSEFIQLKGYHLFEVYNHKDFQKETGLESAEWLARVLLNHGVHFWVTAGDDFHGPYRNTKFDECFGGWVMVQAEKNVNSIVDALYQGQFYASTGPQILYYAKEGQRIKIKTSDAQRIIFYSNLRRCKNVFHNDGSTLNEAEYELSGKEKYIWTKVVDSRGKTAWTQPFFLAENE